MVGLASIFAVSTYMEIPQEELRSFLTSTLLFFLVILVLAILCIIALKFLLKIKQKLNARFENSDQVNDKE